MFEYTKGVIITRIYPSRDNAMSKGKMTAKYCTEN